MFEPLTSEKTFSVRRLMENGFWPAQAAVFLDEKRFSRTVEICRERLEEDPDNVAGRLIYAKALFLAGQLDSAGEQFYHILTLDPDNMVALKHLADLKFGQKDEMVAMGMYQRILEIDPYCRAVCSELQKRPVEQMKTITLDRRPEQAPPPNEKHLRKIPFVTETIGDLYLSQGHHRLAAHVFRTLDQQSMNPRLQEKLKRAEKRIATKE